MESKKIFYKFRDYLLFAVLLLISLILISTDQSENSFSGRKIFFGMFAYTNSIFDFANLESISQYSEKSQYERASKLMLENNLLRKYGLENSQLKKMLSFKAKSNLDLFYAEIIGRNIEEAKSFLILETEKADSIKKEMTVITSEGFVGIVDLVSSDFIRVLTFQNVNLNVTVSVERNGINGLLNWDGTNLLLKNIPSNYDVKIGDRIVVSSISKRFEANIPIGIVTEKGTSISGYLTDFIVEPFNDLTNIRNCFVVNKTNLAITKELLK